MGKMQGLVAIVTGSSRGLGKAIAMEYAREGASVVVSARPESPTGLPGTISATTDAILAEGGDAFAVPCDVSEDGQVEDMVRQVMERYGRIDVLVNNAGIMVLGESLLEIDPPRWRQSMAVNVDGPYFTCRHVVPVMIDQRRGSIINIGSGMGSENMPGGGVLYSAGKAALHMFSFVLAGEVREHNIAVNILRPGSLKSEGSAAIPWSQHDWNERIEPEEVGPCAVYLALQDAQSMTGQLVKRADFGVAWGV